MILYLDMDGVVANFDKEINRLCPNLFTGEGANYEGRAKQVDAICEANRNVFRYLEPIAGAKEGVEVLKNLYEIYFLSTPMWNVPESFMDKRLWIVEHFGEWANKRLILTHRKDLNIGEYLVDDRTRNGVDKFKGIHVHFGQSPFEDWESVTSYLTQCSEIHRAFEKV